MQAEAAAVAAGRHDAGYPEGEVQPHKSWAQLMSAGLAGVRAEDPTALPTIIYASRTHSQLKQVMGELESTGYKCACVPHGTPCSGACRSPAVISSLCHQSCHVSSSRAEWFLKLCARPFPLTGCFQSMMCMLPWAGRATSWWAAVTSCARIRRSGRTRAASATRCVASSWPPAAAPGGPPAASSPPSMLAPHQQ